MLIQECLTTFSAKIVRKHILIPHTNKVCTQNIHLLRQDQIRVQEDLLHCKFYFRTCWNDISRSKRILTDWHESMTFSLLNPLLVVIHQKRRRKLLRKFAYSNLTFFLPFDKKVISKNELNSIHYCTWYLLSLINLFTCALWTDVGKKEVKVAFCLYQDRFDAKPIVFPRPWMPLSN